MKTKKRWPLFVPIFVLGLVFISALPARAAQSGLPVKSSQSPSQQTNPAEMPSTPEKTLTNYVEAGGNYESLSSNFGRWKGGYFRGALTTGKNTWNAEVNGQYQFGDAGAYIDAGDTYIVTDDWYAAVTFGSGVGGFFWPRSRFDGFINRKWLSHKQLITTLGIGYDHAKDVHSDHSVFVGSTYYFEKRWIIEDGLRFNMSSPGAVFSPSGFVAVTEGAEREHYVIVNVGVGQEAYQLVGPTSVLARFPSQTATLTWRQWVSRSWGFNFIGDFYRSPYYRRGGASVGLFKEF